MASRINASSGTPWEPIVGYSRAVKTGPMVHVSGTTSTDDAGEIVGVGDPYAQTMQTIKNIEKALHQVDANLSHVVRTRIFLTKIDSWQEVARAHAEFFKDIRPCTSMLEVRRLIDPDMLVEIEAEAWVE